MKNILMLWQRIHYSVFVFNKFTQIYVFGFPILLILKNKYIKRAYQKRGVQDPEKIIRNTLIDPKRSTIIWLSDGFMCILIILMIFTISNVISVFFDTTILTKLSKPSFVLICLIPTLVINYFALWKDDKYLIYFKEFDEEPKKNRQKWYWISFATIIGILSMIILSFYIMTNPISKNNSRTNLSEKEISKVLNKAEDSLYQGLPKDFIDKEKEIYLEKLEDSLYNKN